MLIKWIIYLELISSLLLFGYKPLSESYTPLPHDPRKNQLFQFMEKHKFAKPYYINDYINAADQNRIDFTVLPVINVLESSGCRHYLRNNCFGWNSAETGFASIQEGIHYVSAQLANGHYYKGKTLERKIKTYNSVNPAYYGNFIKLVNEIK